MPTILLILFLLVVFFFIGKAVYKHLSKSEVQLQSKFDKLRKLILEGMTDHHKKEAKKLLDRCESYLSSLIRAQQKLELLDGMSQDVAELTGENAKFQKRKIQKRIQEDLNRFFSELSRISSVSDFDEDQSIAQLSDFTEDVEENQKVILDLTFGKEELSYKKEFN